MNSGDIMLIKKVKNHMGSYDFYLIEGRKILKVIFCGNLDLYMSLSNGEFIPDNENVNLYLDITKEDYEIYELFDSLYIDIISGNVFGNNEIFNNKYNFEDYTKTYEYSILVDKNYSINWISDDGPAELEDVLKILKLNGDVYRLIFQRNDKPMDFGFKSSTSISVRFRNSGSRYAPFNCVFMRMFQKLQNVDPAYHQMHFEEYEYTKKLNKKAGFDI